MERKLAINENIETLFGQLEKFLKTETVVGEPMTVGGVSLVPLITISFGCGTGGGTGGSQSKSGEMGDGLGSGLGVGAKISPDAVLVINNGEVTMMPIKGRMNLEKLVDKVPDIMDYMKAKKDGGDEKAAPDDNKNEENPY